MTTTFTVVLGDKTVNIEADEYRLTTRSGKDSVKELYLYRDDKDDPVATFPGGAFHGIYRKEHASALG